jgi:hypothetical protein
VCAARGGGVDPAPAGETGAEDDSSQNDSPDTKAVKFLIGQGVKRIQALEAYNKASQTAYWTNVKLADNVYEVVSYLQRIGIDKELGEVRALPGRRLGVTIRQRRLEQEKSHTQRIATHGYRGDFSGE